MENTFFNKTKRNVAFSKTKSEQPNRQTNFAVKQNKWTEILNPRFDHVFEIECGFELNPMLMFEFEFN